MTKMNRERSARIEDIFLTAAELDQQDRVSYLDTACDGDHELRREVEVLLDSHQTQSTLAFIHKPASEDRASDRLEGRTIGAFEIDRLIGSGGMGDVYLARDSRLGRKVALKVLNNDLLDSSRFRRRFLREAQLVSSLDHPNICPIYQVGETSGHPFIAMQYVEGATLVETIKGKPLSLDRVISISVEIGEALAAAHSQGIMHRDIKSSNVMVSLQGHVKVLDFGLARLIESDEPSDIRLTRSGAIVGTPSYMAPEQAQGLPADHRSDIFSLGVVIYEMATGCRPFGRRSQAETMNAVINDPHRPIDEIDPQLPVELSRVVNRALAKTPEDRYQTVEEMVNDLRRIAVVASLPGSQPLPLRDARKSLLMSRAGKVMVALTVFLLLGVIGLLVYSLRAKSHQTSVVASQIKSLAVLPFKPLIRSASDESLELGMADTLISKLSSIRQIAVRPISAVRKYSNLDQDAIAAGREQQVDAVLDGQIQRSGDKVRVTARLIRVNDGALLWTNHFDEKMTDIFVVQDSISERVAAAASVKLMGQERERLTKRHTEDTKAYLLYLKGRYELNRLTDDGFRKGLEYFQEARNADPKFAPAYAGIAESYITLVSWNALSPREACPKAMSAAKEALALDDHLAEAITSLAAVKFIFDHDWTGAEREFKRAIEINQSSSAAHYVYSYYLSAMGRFDEALEEMRSARDLDPLSLEKMSGIPEILRLRRQYDEALAQFRTALEMDPNSGFLHWALGNTYVEKGMYEQAIAEYQKAIPASGDSPDELASLGFAYGRSGKRKEALQVIDELKARSKRSYIPPTLIAYVYGGLAETDQAFAWLDKAFDERDHMLVLLKVEPIFDGLRSDPRFAALLRRVGFNQ